MENRRNAVVFDMDGVIFDSERLVLECWEQLGREHALEDMREVFLSCIGTNKVKTKEIVLARYGQDFPYDRFSQMSSELFHKRAAQEGLPLKKGVRELLSCLSGQGVLLGLASSTRLAVVKEELEEAGLLSFFRVVMGGDQLRHSKPEPDIYLMTCEKMGVDPKETYAIEDSYNGVRAAYRAGMKPVMVPDMLPPTDEMREMSIEIFEDLTQVQQYLIQQFVV